MPVNPKHALPPFDALPGGTEYSFTRDFDAPRELLFEAWTNPAHMAQWWGPKGFTNPVCEMDLRPGGRFRIDMCGPDGMVYPFKGAYIEIDPPARLVYSNDTYDHPEEWHDLVNPNRKPGEAMPCPITTVTFEDLGGKTRLTVRMSFANNELREAHLQVGMHSGWTESMVKLDALLTGEEPVNDATISLQVSRRLDVPAERVYDAWLNPDVARHFLFATREGEMLRIEIDARLGGRFVVVEKRGEVEAFHTGEYMMLAANARPKIIAFSFATDPNMLEVSYVRVHIVPLERGCEVTLIHELDQKWAEHLERPRAGWTRMLDMLAAALASEKRISVMTNANSGDEVLITREFKAPREVVFRAWTEPEQLLRWYAPAGCSIRFRHCDVRAGGHFHSCIVTPDGHECWCAGEYSVVEPPARLVHTMRIANAAGEFLGATEAGMDPAWPDSTRLTVTFEEVEGGTRLTLHQTVDEALARRTGAYPSWLSMFDRLAELLAESRN